MADQEPEGNLVQPDAAAEEPDGMYQGLLSHLVTRLTPGTGEYHGDAAARVFDIQELLEQILLRLGDDFYTPRKPSPESERAIHFPVLDPFVIQRVSRTFQNAITGSVKLRRMMFLESDPDPQMATASLWPPALYWFLHMAGVPIDDVDEGDDEDDRDILLLPRLDLECMQWKMSADFLKRKDYQGASWQHIKVACPKNEMFGINISVVVDWKAPEPSLETRRSGVSSLHIQAGGCATLHGIREWLRFVDATVEECEAQRINQWGNIYLFRP